jgi:hypothetical protein
VAVEEWAELSDCASKACESLQHANSGIANAIADPYAEDFSSQDSTLAAQFSTTPSGARNLFQIKVKINK